MRCCVTLDQNDALRQGDEEPRLGRQYRVHCGWLLAHYPLFYTLWLGRRQSIGGWLPGVGTPGPTEGTSANMYGHIFGVYMQIWKFIMYSQLVVWCIAWTCTHFLYNIPKFMYSVLWCTHTHLAASCVCQLWPQLWRKFEWFWHHQKEPSVIRRSLTLGYNLLNVGQVENNNLGSVTVSVIFRPVPEVAQSGLLHNVHVHNKYRLL